MGQAINNSMSQMQINVINGDREDSSDSEDSRHSPGGSSPRDLLSPKGGNGGGGGYIPLNIPVSEAASRRGSYMGGGGGGGGVSITGSGLRRRSSAFDA